MNQRPPPTLARRVGLAAIGVMFLVLIVFLVITWIEGDTTNNLEEHQPNPSPSSTR